MAGSMQMRLKKATWVENSIGAITTSLMTLLTNNGLILTSLLWNGATDMTVQAQDAAGGDDFTYAKFNTMKTTIDAYVVAQGITMVFISWSE
jgi:hypothetical protein